MTKVDLEQSLKNLALMLAVHCVRNTIIEDYHTKGKITDPEMMAFNKEVVDNMYTFLQVIHNPIYHVEKEVLSRNNRVFYMPVGWDVPKLNQSILKALQITKKL